MNLDDKLKLAHEWAMSMLAKDPRYSDATDFDARAWQYADAMEAEYNKRKLSGFPDVLLTMDKVLIPSDSMGLEWQPDWSVAPDWANWWCMDGDMKCHFSDIKPIKEGGQWVIYSAFSKDIFFIEAGSFNYQGDWKDSLRERP